MQSLSAYTRLVTNNGWVIHTYSTCVKKLAVCLFKEINLWHYLSYIINVHHSIYLSLVSKKLRKTKFIMLIVSKNFTCNKFFIFGTQDTPIKLYHFIWNLHKNVFEEVETTGQWPIA